MAKVDSALGSGQCGGPQSMVINGRTLKMQKRMMQVLGLSMGLALAGVTWAETPKEWNAAGGEKDDAMLLTPDLENGMDVYEVGAACHLTEGWGTEEGT